MSDAVSHIYVELAFDVQALLTRYTRDAAAAFIRQESDAAAWMCIQELEDRRGRPNRNAAARAQP